MATHADRPPKEPKVRPADSLIIGALAKLLIKDRRDRRSPRTSVRQITAEVRHAIPEDLLQRAKGFGERSVWGRIASSLNQIGADVADPDEQPPGDEEDATQK